MTSPSQALVQAMCDMFEEVEEAELTERVVYTVSDRVE